MSGLTVAHLSKRYGTTPALDDVSLEVEAGELVCLLGTSGCGKTTLLRSIAGLAQPDAGRVTIAGRDVTTVPTRVRPIGMVFQSYALFPNMRIVDNVGFPLKVRGIPKREVRLRSEELLDLVGLADAGRRFPNELSGGQQQRVALARALAPEPSVLLLDEPLSALDAVIRTSLRDEIRRVQQQVGITTVYVTHDQSEAMAVADRVAVMSRGRIEEIAPPAEIYERPASRFTATFVGSRNLLELPVGDDRTVRWGDVFRAPAPEGANGRVLLTFRPEDALVRRVDPATPEPPDQPPAWRGEVAVRTFLGAQTRLHVRVGEHVVVADLPSREAAALAVGQPVCLSVRPEAVRVFPV
jgi:putative spermidine/putrescine transport system ATP-binding protein